jgi:hypothetical protein
MAGERLWRRVAETMTMTEGGATVIVPANRRHFAA